MKNPNYLKRLTKHSQTVMSEGEKRAELKRFVEQQKMKFRMPRFEPPRNREHPTLLVGGC